MTTRVRNLTPAEVASGLAEGRFVLVDVREPHETERERIPGSVLLPLSTFGPEQIPAPEKGEVVFSCASGVRSVRAAQLAQAFGFPHDAHLAGGIKSWKAAGLPTEP